MTACRGCDSRLGKPTGSSGFCDPCFIVVRLEKLVFTRAPPHSSLISSGAASSSSSVATSTPSSSSAGGLVGFLSTSFFFSGLGLPRFLSFFSLLLLRVRDLRDLDLDLRLLLEQSFFFASPFGSAKGPLSPSASFSSFTALRAGAASELGVP